MPLSDVTAAMAAAQAALADADYATALDKAIAAQGYLAAEPDSAHAGRSLAWDHNKIEAFIRNVRQRANASAGVQRTKITYARPSISS